MKLLRFVYRYILELDVSYENIVSSEIIYTIFVAINITTLAGEKLCCTHHEQQNSYTLHDLIIIKSIKFKAALA